MLVIKAILVTLLMFTIVSGIVFGVAHFFGGPGMLALGALTFFGAVTFIIYLDMKYPF